MNKIKYFIKIGSFDELKKTIEDSRKTIPINEFEILKEVADHQQIKFIDRLRSLIVISNILTNLHS